MYSPFSILFPTKTMYRAVLSGGDDLVDAVEAVVSARHLKKR